MFAAQTLNSLSAIRHQASNISIIKCYCQLLNIPVILDNHLHFREFKSNKIPISIFA
jgi:hypothetical protein